MSEQTAGYYLMKLQAGTGAPGAPTLNLTLGVYAPTGQVNGEAVITQAILAPESKIVVPQVTGAIHETGFGGNTRLIAVQGNYTVSVQPPAIGTYLAHFSAAIALGEDGTGRATFTYGGHVVSNVPVKTVG